MKLLLPAITPVILSQPMSEVSQTFITRVMSFPQKQSSSRFKNFDSPNYNISRNHEALKPLKRSWRTLITVISINLSIMIASSRKSSLHCYRNVYYMISNHALFQFLPCAWPKMALSKLSSTHRKNLRSVTADLAPAVGDCHLVKRFI